MCKPEIIRRIAYGSFSFAKETREAKIGPLELLIKDKQTVNIAV